MAQFNFTVDIAKVSEMLGKTREVVEAELVPAVKGLSISTHAWLLKYIKDKLNGNYRLPLMLGPEDRNVRWVEVTDGIYVVEIDDSVAWIENGRPPTSMATEDWLLKPSGTGSGKWPKRAKDGSLYRPIPFIHSRTPGKLPETNKPGYRAMVENTMKNQRIPKGIEKNADGSVKLGVLRKLQIPPPGPRNQFPAMYSMPRSEEMALRVGLRPYAGAFHLQGAVQLQRMVKGKKGKMTARKETVVFRMVSTKHKAEGRWMYPKVEGINSLEAAYNEANNKMQKIMRDIEDKLRRAQD